MSKVISVDIETYSSYDLFKGGVYKYAEAPDFEILLIGVGFIENGKRVIEVYTPATLPGDIKSMLTDPGVIKTAYNAQFERVCLNKFFGFNSSVGQWECTMVRAAYFGYPFGLGAVAKAMGLSEEKDTKGKALIRYFSLPCKPTKTNGGRTRNRPEDAPDKWRAFIDYCHQDVNVEMDIQQKLNGKQLPEKEKSLYLLDQIINDRGIKIDRDLVFSALHVSDIHTEVLMKEAKELTGLDNPNSPAQLKEWLSEELQSEVGSLSKKEIPGLIEQAEDNDSDIALKALSIRQELSKTSVKKYQAMIDAVTRDGRVHGLLQFYGASRTGRWAGRLVQIQNLPQNHLSNLKSAREVIRTRDMETVGLFFDNIPDTLSQLIRTSFVPESGKKYIVVDFSAIEARIIAWLAGEKWRIDVFATHGKIYEASASQMFNVPIEEITKDSPLRQKGKVSELALGYQGGPGALIAMGALDMGLSEDELPGIVRAWRQASPRIVALWYRVENAAIEAVENPGKVIALDRIKIRCDVNSLIISLPSGRELFYLKPSVATGVYGTVIRYRGVNQTTKKWMVTETYGGKLVENITQAIARDLLAEALLRLHKRGYDPVMHVHDEVVIEAHQQTVLGGIVEIMIRPVPWAEDLLLKADGFEADFYQK